MRGQPLRLGQLLGRLFAVSGLVVAGAVVGATLSFQHLLDERHDLIQRIDPAQLLSAQLLANYLDEETGVQGYALTGQGLFLEPYHSGTAGAGQADRVLSALFAPGTRAAFQLQAVHRAAAAWSDQFAAPVVAAVARGDRAFATDAELAAGRELFDQVRATIGSLQADLQAERRQAVSRLESATEELVIVMVVALALVLMDGVAVWVALRRLVLRPLAAVTADARAVAGGDIDHEVRASGPVEIGDLGRDVEAMRVRVLAEVTVAREAEERLSGLNTELARSNEDLEQFAYVASHDLQEPLRKVASFCQLLEQRYGGQLDERGHQYIAFAVDGAKRMQVLINDLLAFSRIGRTSEQFEPVDLDECVQLAQRNLAAAMELSDAGIEVSGPLPTVSGDRSLLVALLQNLIGNAIKFRGEGAPAVEVACEEREDSWTLSVTDNGIGIEPRFAERIFVIFQRLHGREAYGGTGIGLAMCRKIVEFHGGRIWLDTDHQPGTRFVFTLPKMETEEADHELDTSVHAG